MGIVFLNEKRTSSSVILTGLRKGTDKNDPTLNDVQDVRNLPHPPSQSIRCVVKGQVSMVLKQDKASVKTKRKEKQGKQDEMLIICAARAAKCHVQLCTEEKCTANELCFQSIPLKSLERHHSPRAM